MKIIGIIKNLFRNLKYRRDKKDEEDLTELVDSSSDNDVATKEENLMIIYRLTRRISLSFIFRLIILVPLSIYLLIILTPIGNIKSFIPIAIEKSDNFLIVVAHPDDECLFFSPTIIGLLSRRKKGHILVFSTGNSNGLGPIRKNELKGSCERLGIDVSRCLSLNLTDLQDNPHRWWAKENISKIVEKYVNEFQIDLLITFDRGGISGHLNHKSLAIGIEYFIKNSDKAPLTYQISTVSFLFQFSSIFNIFPTIIQFLPRLFRNLFSTILPFLFSTPNSERVLFVNSPLGYLKGLKAFHSHRSQMLWYRHFYTTFSRHMFINDLKQILSK
jgi:N-acetylglucosaminylphosphatidylinositol deacetylase